MSVVIFITTVPAHSCVCESTIASQTAIQDETYLFPSTLEKTGSFTSVTNNTADELSDGSYVFCNDEVTLYSPCGIDGNGSYTEDEEENNTHLADVQLHVDSLEAQAHMKKGMAIDHSYNVHVEKMVPTIRAQDLEQIETIPIIIQGIFHLQTVILALLFSFWRISLYGSFFFL